MNDRPCAAAISEHPVTAMAVGEATGEVLEGGGYGASLAMLFVTRAHAGALEDAATVVQEVLRPAVLLGCAAESVLANGWEVEASPAVAVWAGRVGGAVPFSLEGDLTGEDDLPIEAGTDPGTVVLIADPHTFRASPFLSALRRRHPGLQVVGGNASGARGPGGSRLLVDGEVRVAGAVGAVLPADAPVEAVVSQGSRPIGPAWTVTGADGRWVVSLGGASPLSRLTELAHGLPDVERRRLSRGLQLGVLVDEHIAEFGPGDFLVRSVLGGNPATGAIAIDAQVELGQTVQFHVRDAEAADVDLRRSLSGREAAGALLFTCGARGTALYGERHHDASVVADTLDRPATAGFFADGEFGPVARRNFVHGHAASLALFGGRYGG